MNSLSYEFEELPLIVDDGYRAGLVNGRADITFFEDGEWHIDSIYLDGNKPLYFDGKYVRTAEKTVEIEDQKSWLYLTIWDRLQSRPYRESIQDQVCAELDEAGVHARSDREEHSTYLGVP